MCGLGCACPCKITQGLIYLVQINSCLATTYRLAHVNIMLQPVRHGLRGPTWMMPILVAQAFLC